MFAERLPLFFLLPVCGVGGLYLLTVSRFLQKAFEADVTSHQEIAIGEAGILGGTLFLATLLAIGVSQTLATSKNPLHPVASMKHDPGWERRLSIFARCKLAIAYV